jgi:hypothetical protein
MLFALMEIMIMADTNVQDIIQMQFTRMPILEIIVLKVE